MYPVLITVFLSMISITFVSVTHDLSFVGDEYKKQTIHNEYIMANRILDKHTSQKNTIYSSQSDFIDKNNEFTEIGWNNRIKYAVSNEFENPTKDWKYKKAILFADLSGDFIGTNYFLSAENNGCAGSGGFKTNKDWCPKGTGSIKNNETIDIVWTIYDLQQTYLETEREALNQADNSIYKIAHYYNSHGELPLGFTNVGGMDASDSKESVGESYFNSLKDEDENENKNAQYAWSNPSGDKSIPFMKNDLYFGKKETLEPIDVDRYVKNMSGEDFDIINIVIDTGIEHTNGTTIKKHRNIVFPK